VLREVHYKSVMPQRDPIRKHDARIATPARAFTSVASVQRVRPRARGLFVVPVALAFETTKAQALEIVLGESLGVTGCLYLRCDDQLADWLARFRVVRERRIGEFLKDFKDLALGAVRLDDGVDISRHMRIVGD